MTRKRSNLFEKETRFDELDLLAMLPALALYWVLFFPYHIFAGTQYILDNTNATAWTFDNYYEDKSADFEAYNGNYHHCGLSGSNCTGMLMFQGSSVEIFGVYVSTGDKLATVTCRIFFSWPSVNRTKEFAEINGLSHANESLVNAQGFNPTQVSYLSFRQNQTCSGIDYAVVTVEDIGISTSLGSNTGMTNPLKSGPSIGAIVGGVLGGISAVVILLGLVMWRRRRQGKQAEKVTQPSSATVDPFVDHIFPHPNLPALSTSRQPGSAERETCAIAVPDLLGGSFLAPRNSLAFVAHRKQHFDEGGNEDHAMAEQGQMISSEASKDTSPPPSGSTGEETESPIINPDLHPVVQARLEELEKAIREVRGQDVPPPAY